MLPKEIWSDKLVMPIALTSYVPIKQKIFSNYDGEGVVVYLVLIVFLLLWPSNNYAKSFVDEKMLERLSSKYDVSAKQRGIILNKLLGDLKNKKSDVKLREVNRFFNQFKYKIDMKLWGKKDYWSTPEEFIGKNGGDCEDFVIAKYFALREIGIPDKKLYLTYVRALKLNAAHMVLSYFETPNSMPLILDNYNPRILPANSRKDLLPVYSFNAESLFLSNSSAGLGRSLPTDKIKSSKWKTLLSNLKRSKK